MLVVKADPVIETDPVNCCVLVKLFPKIFEPEEYTIEEVIVWTTNVWAVIVPVNSAFEPVMFCVTFNEPVMAWLPLKLFEPVVAYCPSIKVTLPAIDPEVEENEEDTTAKDADELVRVVILVSSVVNLVDNEADCAAKLPEALVKVLAVASKFPVLILKEPDADA